MPRSRKPEWLLQLYIAGETPRAMSALGNLRAICEEHLPDMHQIEVIDIRKNPSRAECDQIIALPTLVRRRPPPARTVVGNLSDINKVLASLDIRPAKTRSP